MLKAQSTQFSMNEHGQILYQAKLGNPLPGEPVAILKKSTLALEPALELLDVALGFGDGTEVKAFLSQWLAQHIKQVLEPLMKLQNIDESVPEPVREVYARVFEAMGVVPRIALESQIAKLDADTRRFVRDKKIKLGPILVFQPDLNKPAAIKLKALLWSLFHEKPFPAPLPKEGIVSFAVQEENPDALYYQVIGYPVYAGRAVRIDMLDRVVNAVYDSAKAGKFQAQHAMAEWLGCGTEDLYKILEAMGHKKASDPDPDEKVSEGEKPSLATFYLKKGRASAGAVDAKPKGQKLEKRKPKYQNKKAKPVQKGPKVIKSGPKTMPEDSPFAVLAQLKKD